MGIRYANRGIKMKAAFLFSLLLFSAPNLWAQRNVHSDTEFKFQQLHWLTGTWERLGMSNQRRGIESWEIESDSVYKGIGLTLSGSDTVFVERLKILVKDDRLFYVADVPENPKPVYYELTETGNNYFVSQNPDHDFPQEISYYLEDGDLRIVVSSSEKKIEYRFRKEKVNR